MSLAEPPVGVLALNLGTPDAPTTGDVRRYLREFLSDPDVIDIHPLARWLLLNLIILPLRPANEHVEQHAKEVQQHDDKEPYELVRAGWFIGQQVDECPNPKNRPEQRGGKDRQQKNGP